MCAASPLTAVGCGGGLSDFTCFFPSLVIVGAAMPHNAHRLTHHNPPLCHSYRCVCVYGWLFWFMSLCSSFLFPLIQATHALRFFFSCFPFFPLLSPFPSYSPLCAIAVFFYFVLFPSLYFSHTSLRLRQGGIRARISATRFTLLSGA
uniref:Uncharacterized protein n=1 Tax=Trypanosoma vivax (strain Y486) TaxID=1055687 RepID=G0U7T8_TRYVY|nr:hypothetical protein TVY486_1009910 [Trypanosoma vivax Y486]